MDAIDLIGLDGFESPSPKNFPAGCANAWGSHGLWCCNPICC